jgi:hypothetical protein
MMWRVTTPRSKQYGEYRLSAINYSGESIKNRDYLTEFEAKFDKSLKTEYSKWLERSPSVKKSEIKNLVGSSL